MTDRTGTKQTFSDTRHARFVGVLREYEGWAARLRADFGGAAVNYVKDRRLIEEPIDTLEALAAHLLATIHPDDPETAEIVAHLDDAIAGPSVLLKVTEKRSSAVTTVPLPGGLFASPAYASLRKAHARLREMAGPPPYELTLGRRTRRAGSFEALRTGILDLARDGLQLSRFKGLGEMNPDQLRATTMDPASRTLQRVTMEDAERADELFTDLMGDNVEPRRKFIEEHARSVRFLDV